MSTLASLVVDLQVQHAQLKQALDEATKKFDDFGKTAEGLGKKISQAFTWARVQQGLSQLAGFVAEGVTALADEERSASRLSSAFEALGYDAQAIAPYFNELAERLESETLVPGETIRQVEQLMVQFGVAPRAIEQATRAVLDYSAATGKDAVGATQQLLTAVSSGNEEVRKMGISFESTGDVTRDLTLASEQMAEQFGGSASAATQGLAGQMGRMEKATQDLGKALAEFVLKSGVGQKVLDALTKTMEGLAYALGEEAEATNGMVDRAERLAGARNTLISLTAALATKERDLANLSKDASDFQRQHAQGGVDAMKARVEAASQAVAKIQAEIEAASQATTEAARAAVEARDAEATAAAKQIAADNRRKKLLEEQRDAARAAQKAQEEMHRALEKAARDEAEQMKRALDLATNLAAISRGVDARRAKVEAGRDSAAADPRAGFEGVEEALVRMQVALEDEAELRYRAGEMERAGDFEGAAAALKAADAQRALADRADAAADALADAEKASRDATKAAEEEARAAAEASRRASQAALDSMVSRAIGPVQGLIDAGTQGASAGALLGPGGAAVGAVAGVGLELLMQSEQFSALMDTVGGIIQTLADAVGAFIEPLLPLAQLFAVFAEAIASVLVPLFKMLEPVFKVLEEVVRGFMRAILMVADFIVGVINGIAGFFGLGKLDDSGIKAGLDKLSRSTTQTADATEKLGKAAESATEEILNAPQGFKGLAGARWAAADLEGGGGMPVGPPSFGGPVAPPPSWWKGPGGGGGPGGGAVEVHINADLARYIQVESRQRNYAGQGSTRPVTVGFSF